MKRGGACVVASLAAVLGLRMACVAGAGSGGAWAEELDRSFALDGERSILKAADCGLVNGHLSVNG